MRQAIWIAVLGGSALVSFLVVTGRVSFVVTPSVVVDTREAPVDESPEPSAERPLARLGAAPAGDGQAPRASVSAPDPKAAAAKAPGAIPDAASETALAPVSVPERQDRDPVDALPEPGVAALPGAIAAPEPQTDPAVAPGAPAAAVVPEPGAASSLDALRPDRGIAPAAVPERADDDPVETLAQPETVTAPAPDAPRFDVVRVEDDGHAVIAGRAEPGSEIEVLLDGEPVATVTADRGGAFAAFTELGTSSEPRALQLRVTQPRDDSLGSSDPGAPDAEPGTPDAASDATTGSTAGAGETPASGMPAVIIALAKAAAPEGDALVDDPERAVPPRVPRADPVHGARLSTPLVLLPSGGARDAAPVVVSPGPERVALVQPQEAAAPGVVLDRLTYDATGRAVLGGRARAGNTVRAYANARFVDDARVAETGQWSVEIPTETARGTELLRFDEIGAGGEVISRVETRFSYDIEAGPQEVQERTIVVLRGDNLWRIAESFYGEGLRYSVIFDANASQIRDPDLIYPDQVFSVPELVPADD